MGPNGSGKSTLSHVLMGKPGYEVLGGSVTLDGVDLLALPTWQRAQAGLFLAMQYPIEVPGVSLGRHAPRVGAAPPAPIPSCVAARVTAEADRIGFDHAPRRPPAQRRPLRRREEAQRDAAARRARARSSPSSTSSTPASTSMPCGRARRRVEAATKERDPPSACSPSPTTAACSPSCKPDVVHVLARGRIQLTGGPELAAELEDTGYAAYGGDAEPERTGRRRPARARPVRRPVRLGARHRGASHGRHRSNRAEVAASPRGRSAAGRVVDGTLHRELDVRQLLRGLRLHDPGGAGRREARPPPQLVERRATG